MISITEAVYQVLQEQSFIADLLRDNLINTTQYAKTIQDEIEKRTFKKVTINSIVTAISRIKDKINHIDLLKPKLSDIQFVYPITDLVVELNSRTLSKIDKINSLIHSSESSNFISITAGVAEINFFLSSSLTQQVKKILKEAKIIFERSELTAITCKLADVYIDVPGVTYQLLRSLFLKNLNIIETVTTFRETTFFVERKNTQKTIEILSSNFIDH
jgi:hypothetical protein